MQTIRKRLSILFVISSISAILLITVSVNWTIGNKFNKYMVETQNRLYDRIVDHFQEIYKKQGKWAEDSGIELTHEAYMSNYCLILLDSEERLIWGMDPNELVTDLHFNSMNVHDRGVYKTKRFEIVVDDKIVGYVDIGQYTSVLLSQEDINFKNSINRNIVGSGAITLIVIIGISLYFSKQFSTPIKEVARLSVNLSRGDFDTTSDTVSNIEEIENLRISVNILAEKLKYQDSLRRRLVSDISHEIRTPLNVLQNNLEAMIDGVFPATPERLEYLNEEVIRFGRLLNNLNVLKEFESESIKLSCEEIYMNDFIAEICKDFYRSAENKNIQLSCNIPLKDECFIIGDKDKLKQVFINLISNALKFTKEGGSVEIDLFENSKDIMLEVKDTGIGIKKEDLPFIFERLYRGDKSRHEIEGSGIGLTIVKNILRLHNAAIEVESIEGEGSVFKIKFNRSG